MEINAEVIKDLIKALSESRMDALRLETDGFKLGIKRCEGSVQPAASVTAAAAVAVETQVEKKPETVSGNVVTSPIVGTFYASAAPDKPAFAKAGQQVKKGDTLFIVESMKLMNEITSEYEGTVAEFYVKDGQGVEYGQNIMRIE